MKGSCRSGERVYKEKGKEAMDYITNRAVPYDEQIISVSSGTDNSYLKVYEKSIREQIRKGEKKEEQK